MPSAGFNIRLSASNVDAVRKALEQVGKSGEGALKQIDRSARQTNSQGLKAVNTGLRELQIEGRIAVQRLGPLGSALTALGPAGIAAGVAIVGLTAGIGALGSAVLSNAREFESLRARLKTVTGSADLAAAAFERIKDFAASTPFEVQNLVTAFTRLKAAGIDPTTERLRSFGDTAAAFGKDITEFADAVVGAITGEGERLKQFGIIARFEADQVRFSFRGASKEVTRDAESIVAALEEIGATAFAGGMEEQSKTLLGVISNLSDAWSNLLDTIDQTAGISETAKGFLRELTGELNRQAEAVQRLDENSREGLAYRRGQLTEALNSLQADNARAAEERRRAIAGEAGARVLRRGGAQMVARDLELLQQEAAAEQELRDRIAEVNKELEKKARLEAQTSLQAAEQLRLEKAAVEASKAEAAAKEKAEAAAKEAARAAKRLASEQERQLAQIAKLEEQAAQAGLEGIELLKVRRDQALAEYSQQKAKELDLEEDFARARRAIEEKFQKDKAEIERDAREKREEERKREADKAAREAASVAEKREQEAAREAERQAEIMRRPFENALDGIQDSFTDFFEKLYSGGLDSFEDLAEGAKRIFVRLAAELTTLQLFRGGAAGILTGGLLPGGGTSAAGLGSTGGGSGSFNLGGLLSIGNLTQGGILNLGGGGSGMAFGGAGGAFGQGAGAGAVSGGGLFNLGNFSLGGFLGSAGLGFGAGSLVNSLVGGNSLGGTIGSGIGSLAGGLLLGPLGALGGGALGGIIGGLFGGDGRSVGPNAVGLNTVSDGRLAFSLANADNGGSVSGATQFARGVAQQVNAILESLGADLAGGQHLRVGSFGEQFRVGTYAYNGGRLDRALGTDPQAAAESATLYAFEALGLEGLDPVMAQTVRRAAQISDGLEDFNANLGVAAAILDESLFDSEEISQAGQALNDLAEAFDDAATRAERLGLSVAKVEELREKAIQDLTEGFDEGIRAQILALTDPITGALEQQAKTAEQRLREAETLGANLVEVERLNALERQRVLEQAGGGLQRFFEELTFGGLSGVSPGASVEGSRAAFEAAVAGGSVGEIERLGRGLLTTSRGAYASGGQFQSDLARVTEVVGGLISSNDNGMAEVAFQGAQQVSLLGQILERLDSLANENARLNEFIKMHGLAA